MLRDFSSEANHDLYSVADTPHPPSLLACTDDISLTSWAGSILENKRGSIPSGGSNRPKWAGSISSGPTTVRAEGTRKVIVLNLYFVEDEEGWRWSRRSRQRRWWWRRMGRRTVRSWGLQDGEQRITMASFLSQPSCWSAAYHCWDTYDHDPPHHLWSQS